MRQSPRAAEAMSNSRKKVIVRRFSGDTLPGYLSHAASVRNVRDFNLADTQNSERLSRRAFLARPRTEGLWLRLTFRTGDLLEGLAPTDATLLDDIIHDAGLH